MSTRSDDWEDSAVAGLRPPRERVDPRCRSWWLAQVVVSAVCVVGPLFVLGLSIEAARWWFLTPAIVAAVLSVMAMVVVPRVRWAIHRWEATDQALYSRSGLFWHEWRAAPLSRVQSVDMVRGPLQQRFGLATISVTTASAKGEVKIQALDADVAEAMVDRFTLLTEADQQDAT
ncbi:PH domain-containing protein [Ornithinimicrobium faecis]|uniref:PH domain-containing protein n=1 Tax=Ornithinimicrobium faecis TaxID=2934158 RepID=A0ABY4YWZ4_9MICO|nr:PH domain-containing protein [Ornithinimicrobium sp. HY1793]USQ81265.1 PH domain-containing protein [Ornithinimicrobium sp. HY1793]